MSPTAPKKYSLDFLLDYYFNTKSPVVFTSPLALYRDAKKRYSSLTFCQVKTYNPKTPSPFIDQFGIIFRGTESLLLGFMISGMSGHEFFGSF